MEEASRSDAKAMRQRTVMQRAAVLRARWVGRAAERKASRVVAPETTVAAREMTAALSAATLSLTTARTLRLFFAAALVPLRNAALPCDHQHQQSDGFDV